MSIETQKVSALNLAKYFVKNEYDEPRNTKDGNMKLQKLLYFSQLIHLAKYNMPLFEEPIFAFKNGSVIENVRHQYQYQLDILVSDANQTTIDFSPEINETITLTEKIFGTLSATELSEINHEQFSWQTAYENSKTPFSNYHEKEKSMISIDDILAYDIDKIKIMISSFENNTNQLSKEIFINGVTFIYNPKEVLLNESILNELKEFADYCDEKMYSIYFDEMQGLVIF